MTWALTKTGDMVTKITAITPESGTLPGAPVLSFDTSVAGTFTGTVVATGKSGKEKIVQVSLVVDSGIRYTGNLVIARDLTTRRHANYSEVGEFAGYDGGWVSCHQHGSGPWLLEHFRRIAGTNTWNFKAYYTGGWSNTYEGTVTVTIDPVTGYPDGAITYPLTVFGSPSTLYARLAHEDVIGAATI